MFLVTVCGRFVGETKQFLVRPRVSQGSGGESGLGKKLRQREGFYICGRLSASLRHPLSLTEPIQTKKID